jgi:PAS domain S-box-containing protein
MTTYLEPGTAQKSHSITTLSRFPAGKIGAPLMAIIQSAMDGVIVVDALHRIVLVNRKAEHMFGYPAEQLLEKPLDILMPPRPPADQRRHMDRLASTRVNGRRAKVELKGLSASGEMLTLNASISRVSMHGELFVALVLREASACKSTPSATQRPVRPSDLRRWAASSQQAMETERRRFSRKLYDDIGQRLSVLKLDLDWLESSLRHTDEGLPARVAQMQGLLDNVIAMTKSMASALRPPLLDDFGLLPAVQWMADNFEKKTAVVCTVENDGLAGKLDDPIESAVFRVIQEGLMNIEKHSHATQVRIAFTHTGNQLDVMIQDNGTGMARGSENKPGCYGLIAMQERVFALGGTISIRNAEPNGLVIYASIPIEPIFHNEPISRPPPRL